jgi:hypothetical protein
VRVKSRFRNAPRRAFRDSEAGAGAAPSEGPYVESRPEAAGASAADGDSSGAEARDAGAVAAWRSVQGQERLAQAFEAAADGQAGAAHTEIAGESQLHQLGVEGAVAPAAAV